MPEKLDATDSAVAIACGYLEYDRLERQPVCARRVNKIGARPLRIPEQLDCVWRSSTAGSGMVPCPDFQVVGSGAQYPVGKC
jgi:hypothetical protein